MENQINEMNETIVDEVVESLPILTEESMHIDDISKSNVVDAVKLLSRNVIDNFKVIDQNESSFRNELDNFNLEFDLINTEAAKLTNDITDIDSRINFLESQVKALNTRTVAGIVIGSIGIGIAVWCAKKIFTDKKTEVVEGGETNE